MGERASDLPMVAVGILDPAEAPAVFIRERPHLPGARRERFGDGRVRVLDDQRQPRGRAAERLRAEVEVIGGLVGDPHEAVADEQLRDDRLVLVAAADAVDLDGVERPLVEVDRLAPAPDRSCGCAPVRAARAIASTCSTFARSSSSALGAVANHASRISPSSACEVARRLSASTFASFQRRAPAAVAASRHSAARTPATLLAAIDAPVPVQQHTMPCWARPAATSRATASDAHAQSHRSASASAPCSSGSWPRRSSSAAIVPATPVSSSAESEMRTAHPAASRTRSRNSLCRRSSSPELGVEGDGEHRALARRHRVAVNLAEDLHLGPVLGDPRRANEDRAQRTASRPRPRRPPRSCGSGGRTRCARRACPSAQMVAVEHDQPRARAEDRRPASPPARAAARPAPRARSPSVIVVDSPPGITSPSRPSRSAATAPRACAARWDPTSPASARAPRTRPAARARRSAGVLQPGCYQPRWASSCSPSSLELSRLTIAVPRPARGLRRRARRPASGWSPRRSRAPASAGPRT